MEYFNGALTPDFNKIYTNIENCKIIKPPYHNGRVPETFFLDKRGAFVSTQPLGFDIIYDTISDAGIDYYIGKLGTNILVKKLLLGVLTTISTTPYTSVKKYKFIYGPSAKGTSVKSGTGMTSNLTNPLNLILEDLTGAYIVNAYAGMYCYITGGTGIGQIVKIISNTATQLTISGLKSDVIGGTYSIFPSFGSIPFFIGGDGLYGIHGVGSVISASNFTLAIDIAYVQQRFFSLDVNGNINKGFTGESLLYQDSGANVTTVNGVKAITPFQDYLLVLSATSISLIRKELVTVGGTSVESFFLIEVTSDFGVFSSGSFSIYNEGLYIFNSDKRFLSVSIRPITASKFMTSINDEGIYIQKDLDNIGLSSLVNLYIDSNEIKLINTYTGNTDFFIYDRFYRGWHKWNTPIQINGYYNSNKTFYGSDAYLTDNAKTLDAGVDGITQRIKLIFGSDNFSTIKNVKFQKIIIGTGTTSGVINNYNITSGENLIQFPKQIKGSKLQLQGKVQLSAKGSSLGQAILGLGLISNSEKSIKSLYPQLGNIKINLGFACELIDSELIAGPNDTLVFGGQTIGFELAEVGVTSVKNVI